MKKILLYSSLLLIFACSYTQKIANGDMAFERKQFAVAARMLPEEYNKEKSRVNKGKIAYKLGKSFERMNKNEESIEWFKTAYDNSYGIDALKDYAFALKRAGRYKEAKLAFKELGIEIGSPYEYRKEISACDIVQGWKDNESLNPYKVVDSGLNSANADYAPVIMPDGNILFTSDRKPGGESATYNWTGNNFSSLWVFDKESFDSKEFSDQINSEGNEGTAAFNSNYTTIIFSRCFSLDKDDKYCKLMSSSLENDQWTEPQMLNFTKPMINYGHPSFGKDDNTLYFSSNDPDGWGGYDIYLTTKTAEGWSEPKLLSRAINTEMDDKFPYADGDTLYFASNGHTGMGGLDIYKTYIQNGKRWTPAQNMLPPINSSADDFGFVVDYINPVQAPDLQHGYYTSSREGGNGSDDIYKFTKIVVPPKEVVVIDTAVAAPKPKEIEYKMILNGFVVEQILKDPNNPNSKSIGRRPIPGAQVDINVNGKSIEKVTVDESGFFTIELDEETDYYFFGSKSGYLNNSNRFSSKGIGKIPSNPVQEFEVEIVLDKIYTNREIVLDNIYYDLDKWDIRADAQPTLNELYTTLNQNPNIKIQLNSHTDCQGQDQYNQNLSQKRAQSAIEYLIEQGIDPSRLSAVGYGETKLAINCACNSCTEDEHQANRRTTFTIIEN